MRDNLRHLILGGAAENSLEQQNFPEVHLINQNGVNVEELSLPTPLVGVLVLNVYLNALLVRGVLEVNVVRWTYFKILTFL